jgi:hypothetical protein
MLSATQIFFKLVHPNVVKLLAILIVHTTYTNVSKSTFNGPIVSTPSNPHLIILKEPSPKLNLPKVVDMDVVIINLHHLSFTSYSQARVDLTLPNPSIQSTLLWFHLIQ